MRRAVVGALRRLRGGVGGASTPLAPKRTIPPEPAHRIRTRRYVILSFWLVVLLLGVPIWWVTTTVYRANLPLRQMRDWADGKICSPVFPLRVALEAPSLQRAEAQSLLRSTQHTLDDLNLFSAHHLRLSLPRGVREPEDTGRETSSSYASDILGSDSRTAMVVKLTHERGAVKPRATLKQHSNVLDVFYSSGMLPTSSSSPSVLGSFIATELQELFLEEQALLATLNSTSLPSALAEHLSADVVPSLAKRTTRSVKYAPTYHLTFSLFTATHLPSQWDFEEALAGMKPLLQALSPICNFTIDHQVQPYSTLPASLRPIFDEARSAWVLGEQDLGGFMNTAEWSLSPSIGEAPTIHFLLYAAPPNASPLLVEHSDSNSWLVPQWGGVVIYNSGLSPGSPHPTSLTAQDLKPAILAFSSQLASLLGLPSTPVESLPMRLSTLARVRAASLFFSASSTLGSLARLVSNLPSISIPDSVAENVAATIDALEHQCAAFREGDFQEALENGKVAERWAERAFFEKSMVGQVYFPDEHKVAVYLPLLGPVAVPLVVAVLRELRAFIASRRNSKEKTS